MGGIRGIYCAARCPPLATAANPTAAARRLASNLVTWYIGSMNPESLLVERVQTGVRMERRLLKVLKAFAEYHDLTLGDLLEGIVLHAFDGKTPFSRKSLAQIRELKKFYGLDLNSSASHRLKEKRAAADKTRQEQREQS